jgi:hypothetical protein
LSEASVLPSVYVKTLGVRNTHFEAVPALQGARRPYGLQDSLSTLRPSCSPPFSDSATDARLDTGGWLALTRQGLSPCKKRRAYLGAITCKLRGVQPACRRSVPLERNVRHGTNCEKSALAGRRFHFVKEPMHHCCSHGTPS